MPGRPQISYPFFPQGFLGGGHGDLRCCGVDVFFNAVMRGIKSQFAVLR